jgi:hypothetical protein
MWGTKRINEEGALTLARLAPKRPQAKLAQDLVTSVKRKVSVISLDRENVRRQNRRSGEGRREG